MKMFGQEMKLVEVKDIGQSVVCDFCNADHSEHSEPGGFLFGSYAVCPTCAKRALPEIQRDGDAGRIKGFCPPDKTFRDWVLELRGGDNTIKYYESQGGKEEDNR